MLDCLSRPVIVTVAPTVEPVTVAQMKEHLHVDSDTEDTYIGTLITAARVHLEQETGRAFLSQTLRLRLDGAPSSREILLPRAPLQSVSAVGYIDTAGATQAFTSPIDAVTEAIPGRIVLREGYDWPSVASRPASFWIDYIAGAANVGALDPRIVHAVRFLVAHWFANREPVNIGNIINPLPRAIDALAWQLRVF